MSSLPGTDGLKITVHSDKAWSAAREVPKMSSLMQGSPNRILVKGERGAALLMMLLFLTLSIIFVLTMLATTGDEVVIAGFHRDGVRALDLAQAGIQEAARRVEAGRPFINGFTSSMNPGITVTVVRRYTGSNSRYLELQSTATVGRATRRLSSLVLARAISFPPNTITGASIQSTSAMTSSDAYSQTWGIYSSNPSPNVFYAAWRLSASDPSSIPYCYTHAQCVSGSPSMPNWYPGARRSVNQTSADGIDLVSQTNKCPAGGGGTLPGTTISGILATDPCSPSCSPVTNMNVYGFDTDNPGSGPLAVSASLPCGLPYKYISQTFLAEDGVTNYTRLFKTVVFEQWLNNYWVFNEGQMAYVKTTSLINNPLYGTVAPFPDVPTDPLFYDRVVTGGGVMSGDLGCKYPEMSCTPAVDRPINVLFSGGNYTDGGTLQGHGVIVVNGNLTFESSNFIYYGAIIVNGTTTVTNSATIYGGLISKNIVVSGAFSTPGGGAATGGVLGRSVVVGKGWWER
jgi:Tfp pilus assembly protein PilX